MLVPLKLPNDLLNGLGKFLLRFLGDQPQVKAEVSMVSAFAYSVSGAAPDMLALGFLIKPLPFRMAPVGGGRQPPEPAIDETALAVQIVKRAKKLWDLDRALEEDDGLRQETFDGAEVLLGSANYDTHAWREWVARHPVRPLTRERIQMRGQADG